MPNIRLGSSDYLSRGELDGFAAYLSSSDYLRGASGPLLDTFTVSEALNNSLFITISHGGPQVAITTILIP